MEHASAVLTLGRKNACTPLNGRKGGPYRRHGSYDEEKNILPPGDTGVSGSVG